jgi:hypothetical protein
MKMRSLSVALILFASSCVQLANAEAVPLPFLKLPPSTTKLQQARTLVGADKVFEKGYQGEGTSVVIIDSGVRSDTRQFVGRIATEVCVQLPNEKYCPNNLELVEGPGASEPIIEASGQPAIHGTLTASAVLEFAPQARIIPIRTSGSAASRNAMDWVVKNAIKYNIAAVSMSWGGFGQGARSPSYCQNLDEHPYFAKLLEAGIAPVASSGNDGWLSMMLGPACDSLAVGVGAVEPDTGKISIYSNTDSRLKLLAPTGFEVATISADKSQKELWFDSFTGTSASAPVVAAMFAIGKSLRPDLEISSMLEIARETADRVDDIYVKDLRRVRFDKFVESLLNFKFPIDPKVAPISSLDKSCTPTGSLKTFPAVNSLYPANSPYYEFDDGGTMIRDDLHPGFYDIGLSYNLYRSSDCLYAELSMKSDPSRVWVSRISHSKQGFNRFHIVVPKFVDWFNSAVLLRLALVDQNGNFSKVTTFEWPAYYFAPRAVVESLVANNWNMNHMYPELNGVAQIPILTEKFVTSSEVSRVELETKTAIDKAVADAKVEAEAVAKIAQDKAVADAKAVAETAAKIEKESAASELSAANAALADAQKVNREQQAQLNAVEAQFKNLFDSVSVIQGQLSILSAKLSTSLSGQKTANAKIKKICAAKPKPKGC